ncbi:hypothetical protein ANTPLA_LOCUS5280 [Anthophora plagiata]
MMKVAFCTFLITCYALLSSVKSDGSKCFIFTWVAPGFDDASDRYNCSTHKSVPCFEPLIISENPPNTTEYWLTDQKLCTVKSGNVCIKYTFTYNNDIVNTSSFCGKAIEDEVLPITSGCYEQHVGGYVLEMCACQSRNGREPCNLSVKMKHSIILMITTLLVLINFA